MCLLKALLVDEQILTGQAQVCHAIFHTFSEKFHQNG